MNAPPGRSRYLLPLAYLILGVGWVVGFRLHPGRGRRPQPRPAARRHGEGHLLRTGVHRPAGRSCRAWPREAPLPERLSANLGGAALRPFLIFLLTAIGVVLAGSVLYHQQSREMSQRAADSLSSTTELTARQVEFWVEDRRDGLEFAGRNPLLAHAMVARRDSRGRPCGGAPERRPRSAAPGRKLRSCAGVFAGGRTDRKRRRAGRAVGSAAVLDTWRDGDRPGGDVGPVRSGGLRRRQAGHRFRRDARRRHGRGSAHRRARRPGRSRPLPFPVACGRGRVAARGHLFAGAPSG